MFVLLDLYDIKPWEQDYSYDQPMLKPEDKAAILLLRSMQKDGEERMRKHAEMKVKQQQQHGQRRS